MKIYAERFLATLLRDTLICLILLLYSNVYAFLNHTTIQNMNVNTQNRYINLQNTEVNTENTFKHTSKYTTKHIICKLADT